MSTMAVGSVPEQMRSPVRWRHRAMAVLVAVFLAVGSLLASVGPAQAGSRGVGYEGASGFLGAYNTDVDGRQAYCIDLGAASPFGQTSPAQTVTSLDALSPQQLEAPQV